VAGHGGYSAVCAADTALESTLTDSLLASTQAATALQRWGKIQDNPASLLGDTTAAPSEAAPVAPGDHAMDAFLMEGQDRTLALSPTSPHPPIVDGAERVADAVYRDEREEARSLRQKPRSSRVTPFRI
jgi:hypothetical protein